MKLEKLIIHKCKIEALEYSEGIEYLRFDSQNWFIGHGDTYERERHTLVLEEYFQKQTKPQNQLETIITATSEEFDISVQEIKGKSQCEEIVLARHAFCKIAKMQEFTYKQIGKFISDRDHSTVFNACRRAEDRAFTSEIYKTKLKNIINKIN